MKRIRDYYNWKTLEQWKFVIDNNYVEKKKISGYELSEKELGQAVDLLIKNCFPIAICCSVEEAIKKIWFTPFWKRIFNFLNNKQKIERNNKLIDFQELSEEERTKIMKAEIYSIWIEDGKSD